MVSVKHKLFGFALVGCLGLSPVVRADEAAPVAGPETAYFCAHCKAVWVQVPKSTGKLRVYRSQKGEDCADCRAAIESGATTGAKPTCAHCGELQACQISEASAPPEAVPNDMAVMCNKCETIWVREPQRAGKSMVYRSGKKMVCPECATAVDAVMSGQEASHMCKACGGKLQRCAMN